MKCMYVWESVNELTNNYHDGGGLVIISNDLETARGYWAKKNASRV